MTTDRPVASPRNTALAQRPSSATHDSDPRPAGAAERRVLRDARRAAEGPTTPSRSRAARTRSSPSATTIASTGPSTTASRSRPTTRTQATDDAAKADDDTTPRPVVQPSIFALQLAGPLPTPPQNPAPAARPRPTRRPPRPRCRRSSPARCPRRPSSRRRWTRSAAPVDPNAQPQDQQPLAPVPGDAGKPGGIPLPDLAGLKPPTGDDAKIDLPKPKPTADQPQPTAPSPWTSSPRRRPATRRRRRPTPPASSRARSRRPSRPSRSRTSSPPSSRPSRVTHPAGRRPAAASRRRSTRRPACSARFRSTARLRAPAR